MKKPTSGIAFTTMPGFVARAYAATASACWSTDSAPRISSLKSPERRERRSEILARNPKLGFWIGAYLPQIAQITRIQVKIGRALILRFG